VSGHRDGVASRFRGREITMLKLSTYGCALVLFCAVAIFPTIKIATATDDRNQPAPVAPVATNTLDSEIISGFNSERYASLWERNPFTLVTPSAPPVQISIFDKFILTSWLREGRTDVVFIQNIETNGVEKITAEPNQSNLRLVALHLNPNAQFVEAVISDGKEQGALKFRFEALSGPTASPITQTANGASIGQQSNPGQAGPASLSMPTTSSSNTQTSTISTDGPLTRRASSGVTRAQLNGVPGRSQRGHESEGVHLALPTSGPSNSGKP
jgi:hypothetical protein